MCPDGFIRCCTHKENNNYRSANLPSTEDHSVSDISGNPNGTTFLCRSEGRHTRRTRMPIPLSLTLFHSFGQLLIRTIMPLQHQPPNRTASRRDGDAIVLEIILLPDPPRSSHLVNGRLATTSAMLHHRLVKTTPGKVKSSEVKVAIRGN
ncbi:uncharacterized protein LOC143199189 isoform X1 [Rhynchophorus ferrugineus]|uniref:uncharacterized protein LOC143199189 isoform X1 n=1 Tax=Rhynchophorus ferrugineus TaxID=354439 RepID=UPI003FCE3210